MSVSPAARYAAVCARMNNVHMDLIIHNRRDLSEKIELALRQMPKDFARFNQNQMEDIAESIHEVAEPLEESRAKTQLNEIVSMLSGLYAQFSTVFNDMKEIAESLGQTAYMPGLVDQMNMCGNFWKKCRKYGKIGQDSSVDLFKIMTYVMSTLQKEPRLQGNKRVVYMRDFLYKVYRELPKITDGKNEYLMFRHVKRLIGPYDPPASNLQPVHAEAAKVSTDLAPKAEMTGTNLRIAGLLCDLQEVARL